jgi:cytochrome c-type biogenesis protein CcmH/NrfG
LEKGFALQSIVERRAPEAIKRLEELLQTGAQDGDAQLYLAWAHAEKHEHAKAAAAFTESLKKNPLRIPALYGLARSQVALGQY